MQVCIVISKDNMAYRFKEHRYHGYPGGAASTWTQITMVETVRGSELINSVPLEGLELDSRSRLP